MTEEPAAQDLPATSITISPLSTGQHLVAPIEADSLLAPIALAADESRARSVQRIGTDQVPEATVELCPVGELAGHGTTLRRRLTESMRVADGRSLFLQADGSRTRFDGFDHPVLGPASRRQTMLPILGGTVVGIASPAAPLLTGGLSDFVDDLVLAWRVVATATVVCGRAPDAGSLVGDGPAVVVCADGDAEVRFAGQDARRIAEGDVICGTRLSTIDATFDSLVLVVAVQPLDQRHLWQFVRDKALFWPLIRASLPFDVAEPSSVYGDAVHAGALAVLGSTVKELLADDTERQAEAWWNSLLTPVVRPFDPVHYASDSLDTAEIRGRFVGRPATIFGHGGCAVVTAGTVLEFSQDLVPTLAACASNEWMPVNHLQALTGEDTDPRLLSGLVRSLCSVSLAELQPRS